MVKKLSLYLILLSLSAPLFAQSIEVYASTDSTEYTVGDYIRYKIELKYDNSITVFMPTVQDTIKVLDFIKEEDPVIQTGDKETLEIHTYIFSKYDSAGVTIPSVPIGFTVGNETQKSVINTNPVNIVVRTVNVDQTADIFDVKAPLLIPYDWWLIAIIVVSVILLALAGYYVYKKYFKKEDLLPQKVIIKIPAYKVALKSLMDLEDKKLWQAGAIKEYHSEITGIIRKYFEERFRVLALEMPSSELLDLLKTNNDFQPVFDTTKSFLENADLVKFAKFQPMASVNEEMMKQAYDIVGKTKEEEELKEETANVQ